MTQVVLMLVSQLVCLGLCQESLFVTPFPQIQNRLDIESELYHGDTQHLSDHHHHQFVPYSPSARALHLPQHYPAQSHFHQDHPSGPQDVIKSLPMFFGVPKFNPKIYKAEENFVEPFHHPTTVSPYYTRTTPSPYHQGPSSPVPIFSESHSPFHEPHFFSKPSLRFDDPSPLDSPHHEIRIPQSYHDVSPSPKPYHSVSPSPKPYYNASPSPEPYHVASPSPKPYHNASPSPYHSASPAPYHKGSPSPFYGPSTPEPYHNPSPDPYTPELPSERFINLSPSPYHHGMSTPTPSYHPSHPKHRDGKSTLSGYKFKPFVYHGPSTPSPPVTQSTSFIGPSDSLTFFGPSEPSPSISQAVEEIIPPVTSRTVENEPVYLSITTPSPFYGPFHQVTPIPQSRNSIGSDRHAKSKEKIPSLIDQNVIVNDDNAHEPEQVSNFRSPRLLYQESIDDDFIKPTEKEPDRSRYNQQDQDSNYQDYLGNQVGFIISNDIQTSVVPAVPHIRTIQPARDKPIQPPSPLEPIQPPSLKPIQPPSLHSVPDKPAISFIDPPSAPLMSETFQSPVDSEPLLLIPSKPLVLNPNILFETRRQPKPDVRRKSADLKKQRKPAALQSSRDAAILQRQKLIGRQSKSLKAVSSNANTLIITKVRDKAEKLKSVTSKKKSVSKFGKSAALLKLMEIAGDDWTDTKDDTRRGKETYRGQFECPVSEGHFPDPEDCSVYYQCAQGTPHRRQCEVGLSWSVDTDMCDWEDNVNCKGQVKLTK